MIPLPELTDENRAFWTGGATGQLLITRCSRCDSAIHPPQLICPHCLSRTATPKPSVGKGRVESWTVNRRAWFPDMEVPFALAIVSLDDAPGVRITARLVDCELSRIAIGDAVTVTFLHRDGIWIPAFRPATPANG